MNFNDFEDLIAKVIMKEATEEENAQLKFLLKEREMERHSLGAIYSEPVIALRQLSNFEDTYSTIEELLQLAGLLRTVSPGNYYSPPAERADSNLLILFKPPEALIRVLGLANRNLADLCKRLLARVKSKRCRGFQIDLSRCIAMDSTFLNVLTRHSRIGLFRRRCIHLLFPNKLVMRLLEQASAKSLFSILSADDQDRLRALYYQEYAFRQSESDRQEIITPALFLRRIWMEKGEFVAAEQFLAEEKKTVDQAVAIKACPRCGKPYPATVEVCSFCGCMLK